MFIVGLLVLDKIPDVSIFSKNHHRRFNESEFYQQIFNEIVNQAMNKGLIKGCHLYVFNTDQSQMGLLNVLSVF